MNIIWSPQAHTDLYDIKDWNLEHGIGGPTTADIIAKAQKELQDSPRKYGYKDYLQSRCIPFKPYDIGYKIYDDNNIIITQVVRQSSEH